MRSELAPFSQVTDLPAGSPNAVSDSGVLRNFCVASALAGAVVMAGCGTSEPEVVTETVVVTAPADSPSAVAAPTSTTTTAPEAPEAPEATTPAPSPTSSLEAGVSDLLTGNFVEQIWGDIEDPEAICAFLQEGRLDIFISGAMQEDWDSIHAETQLPMDRELAADYFIEQCAALGVDLS